MALPPASPAVWNWFVEAPAVPAAIVPGLSAVLGRPVVPLFAADPEALPDEAVLCDVWVGTGDFPVAVDCYAPPSEPETRAAARLARRVGRRVLLPDDTLDPGRHLLVAPDGTLRPVHVDVSDTDARTNLRLCTTGHAARPCRDSRWAPDRVVPALAA
jgi:hypothetical protein